MVPNWCWRRMARPRAAAVDSHRLKPISQQQVFT
jgi:hypothetical protein